MLKQKRRENLTMNNINWDKWFEDDSESMPNCPWIDHEPYDDGTYYGDEGEEEDSWNYQKCLVVISGFVWQRLVSKQVTCTK